MTLVVILTLPLPLALSASTTTVFDDHGVDFAERMAVATNLFLSASTSSLLSHVRHVFVISPEPKMRRLEAWRIVAMVEDKKAVRDRTTPKGPRQTMHSHHCPKSANHSITLNSASSIPFTTATVCHRGSTDQMGFDINNRLWHFFMMAHTDKSRTRISCWPGQPSL